MDIVGVLVALIIGAIAGWLAGVIVEGAGFGLLWNIIIGIAGAFIAALLFPRLGLGLTLGGGIVGAIVTSTLGAVILLLIVNLIQRLAA
ncbi:MAG: GlsB/YeaQ/YmgE family stress response membrane protein [Methyloceanibacter sp.]|uniref:GlsB/YeaQ/YmgE family stress response membrane protein n=1 Tax=Methyloceanibacter sp. TaxID=1965321 RepID=UPI003D6D5970